MKTKEASLASGNWTNAPDKVYLSSCMRSDFIKAVTNGHAGDIEYIRKDALLEWASEQFCNIRAALENSDPRKRGYLCAMADLEDKLKSM